MYTGTIRNNERTGDRDLAWSSIMRKPCVPGLRSCDFDVQYICQKCSLPFMFWEVTRESGFKGTKYVEAMAAKLEIPAYLIRHSGDHVMAELLSREGGLSFYTVEQFYQWVLSKYEQHQRVCNP